MVSAIKVLVIIIFFLFDLPKLENFSAFIANWSQRLG